MSPILIFGYIACFLILTYALHRRRMWAWFLRDKKFKCTRCGHCCRFLVKVTSDDIKRIEKLGYKEMEFVQVVQSNRLLKQKIDGYCTFFKFDSKGVGKCSIYNNRPEICQTFPNVKTYFGKEGWDYRCESFKMPKWL